jgi:hypothetical protein
VETIDFEELPEREPSWQKLELATRYRKRLLKAGYWPLPVSGKIPAIAGWQDIHATDKIVDSWELKYADATNSGALTRDTPGADIDITVPAAADAVEALAREHFEERGRFLVRFGKAPKRMVLLRTDEPFYKITRKFTAPDSSEQKIEILGNGQQVVVAGIHPDTGNPYSWFGGEPGEVRREDLPYVREDDMVAFVDAAAELLIRDFGFKPKKDDDRRKANGNGANGALPYNGSTPGIVGIREKTYAGAALDGCAEELALAASGNRNELLNKVSFRLGRMVVRGWVKRADVEAALLEAMNTNGGISNDGIKAAEATLKSGLDDGEKEPHPNLDKQANGHSEQWEDVVQPKLSIKSSKEFVARFVPPEYVVVGLLQRRFFYSLTGQTGAGKTAIMLLLSACAAQGKLFAGRETKKIRVLYLAAENADDVRMRWIAFAQQLDFDINTIEVYFVEGRFSLSKPLQMLRTEAERQGGEFGMVVVDTSPTFFEGEDENANKQLGDHARILRSLIDTVPGSPCVVANCHPTKNAQPDQLIPRGGGAFLAEADGNLTAAKTDSTVELHWQGKFRGPDFAPMCFLIRTVTHQDLKDRDGRLIPTVIAEHISDQAQENIAAAAQQDHDAVLAYIATNSKASLASICIAMGWKLFSGDPHKTKADRCIKALVKDKLVKRTRTGFKVTPEGKKVLNGEVED